MSITAEPTRDRIFVRDITVTEETKTTSGIVLPESVSRNAGVREVEVVKVGPGTPFETRDGIEILPVCVSEGDKVMIQLYGGLDFELDGEKLILIHEADVLAKL